MFLPSASVMTLNDFECSSADTTFVEAGAIEDVVNLTLMVFHFVFFCLSIFLIRMKRQSLSDLTGTRTLWIGGLWRPWRISKSWFDCIGPPLFFYDCLLEIAITIRTPLLTSIIVITVLQ